MSFITNFPLFTIIFSLFMSVLCMMLGGRKARNITIAYEGILICLVSAVLWYTWHTGSAFTYVMGEFPAPWGNEIRAGVLEALIALTFLIVLICSVVAGQRFIWIDIDESKVNLYYTLVNLMTAALMAMTWTNDIFTGYVFLEILTLTSCGVLIVREIGRTTLAAVRYMILNLLGSGLFLLGVVLLYDITGNLLMVSMHEQIVELAQDPKTFRVLTMAMGVLTCGLGIKSGLFPFHHWMPDTYGWATPTSASLLSALVSKCYIFLLIKIIWRVIGVNIFEQMPIRNILFILGVLGMVFGSVSALRANSINRMVAFSSAAQIGYIYMGIGIGGTAGYAAAIFQILAHAVTKSALFLTTPNLALVSGNGSSLLFKNLQGSALRDRNAGFFFLTGALSMIGIPIFAGFSAKLGFAVAAVEQSRTAKMVIVMAALAVSSLLNAFYFIRTLIRIYMPAPGAVETPANTARHGADYNIPMIGLMVFNLALGLVPWAFVNLINTGFSMFA